MSAQLTGDLFGVADGLEKPEVDVYDEEGERESCGESSGVNRTEPQERYLNDPVRTLCSSDV